MAKNEEYSKHCKIMARKVLDVKRLIQTHINGALISGYLFKFIVQLDVNLKKMINI